MHAYSICDPQSTNKTKTCRTFKHCLPVQNARFLKYMSNCIHDCLVDARFHADPARVDEDSIQENFDDFYKIIFHLLDQFFPLTTITVTSRAPPFITPQIRRRTCRAWEEQSVRWWDGCVVCFWRRWLGVGPVEMWWWRWWDVRIRAGRLGECVKEDMVELGLHPEWAVFRDMWRSLISGKTSNLAEHGRNGCFFMFFFQINDDDDICDSFFLASVEQKAYENSCSSFFWWHVHFLISSTVQMPWRFVFFKDFFISTEFPHLKYHLFAGKSSRESLLFVIILIKNHLFDSFFAFIFKVCSTLFFCVQHPLA